MKQLGVFAKYWEPGQVKTRLAAAVGADRAAAIYRAFVEATLARLAACDCHRVLAYTPVESHAEFQEASRGMWHLQVQSTGDLGQRMLSYFDTALNSGFHKVVLVGSDTPTLPLQRVSEAFAALDHVPAVLGPTCDGGYYLIGLSQSVPAAFQGIAWSTPQVFSQTVKQLLACGVAFRQLPAWYDVDDKPSLERLRSELAAGPSTDPALVALRAVVLGGHSG